MNNVNMVVLDILISYDVWKEMGGETFFYYKDGGEDLKFMGVCSFSFYFNYH